MGVAVRVVCEKCWRDKRPVGRSVPADMVSMFCDDECPGYRTEPMPDCRFAGEFYCGPGCKRGDDGTAE